jgi:pyrroloquinoline quinone (PQQ) biosynthesis protein C
MGVLNEPPAQAHWVDSLHSYVQPYWHDVIAGEWATKLNDGAWSTEAMRGWILHLYPFIHAFPKFLAEALIKVEDEYSRSFLIDNIRVEKAHADHWLWMGEGFGLTRVEMMALAEGDRPMLRDVQSLSDWLWYINSKGSLAEAVAATSFAIEGATGDLARTLLPGFEAYGDRPGVDMCARTTKWLRNHAKYDDMHPKIALEVVKRYARTERDQTRVMLAAKRSLQLLNQALLTGALAHAGETGPVNQDFEHRRGDRRLEQLPIAAPRSGLLGAQSAVSQLT